MPDVTQNNESNTLAVFLKQLAPFYLQCGEEGVLEDKKSQFLLLLDKPDWLVSHDISEEQRALIIVELKKAICQFLPNCFTAYQSLYKSTIKKLKQEKAFPFTEQIQVIEKKLQNDTEELQALAVEALTLLENIQQSCCEQLIELKEAELKEFVSEQQETLPLLISAITVFNRASALKDAYEALEHAFNVAPYDFPFAAKKAWLDLQEEKKEMSGDDLLFLLACYKTVKRKVVAKNTFVEKRRVLIRDLEAFDKITTQLQQESLLGSDTFPSLLPVFNEAEKNKPTLLNKIKFYLATKENIKTKERQRQQQVCENILGVFSDSEDAENVFLKELRADLKKAQEAGSEILDKAAWTGLIGRFKAYKTSKKKQPEQLTKLTTFEKALNAYLEKIKGQWRKLSDIDDSEEPHFPWQDSVDGYIDRLSTLKEKVQSNSLLADAVFANLETELTSLKGKIAHEIATKLKKEKADLQKNDIANNQAIIDFITLRDELFSSGEGALKEVQSELTNTGNIVETEETDSTDIEAQIEQFNLFKTTVESAAKKLNDTLINLLDQQLKKTATDIQEKLPQHILLENILGYDNFDFEQEEKAQAVEKAIGKFKIEATKDNLANCLEALSVYQAIAERLLATQHQRMLQEVTPAKVNDYEAHIIEEQAVCEAMLKEFIQDKEIQDENRQIEVDDAKCVVETSTEKGMDEAGFKEKTAGIKGIQEAQLQRQQQVCNLMLSILCDHLNLLPEEAKSSMQEKVDDFSHYLESEKYTEIIFDSNRFAHTLRKQQTLRLDIVTEAKKPYLEKEQALKSRCATLVQICEESMIGNLSDNELVSQLREKIKAIENSIYALQNELAKNKQLLILQQGEFSQREKRIDAALAMVSEAELRYQKLLLAYVNSTKSQEAFVINASDGDEESVESEKQKMDCGVTFSWSDKHILLVTQIEDKCRCDEFDVEGSKALNALFEKEINTNQFPKAEVSGRSLFFSGKKKKKRPYKDNTPVIENLESEQDDLEVFSNNFLLAIQRLKEKKEALTQFVDNNGALFKNIEFEEGTALTVLEEKEKRVTAAVTKADGYRYDADTESIRILLHKEDMEQVVSEMEKAVSDYQQQVFTSLEEELEQVTSRYSQLKQNITQALRALPFYDEIEKDTLTTVETFKAAVQSLYKEHDAQFIQLADETTAIKQKQAKSNQWSHSIERGELIIKQIAQYQILTKALNQIIRDGNRAFEASDSEMVEALKKPFQFVVDRFVDDEMDESLQLPIESIQTLLMEKWQQAQTVAANEVCKQFYQFKQKIKALPNGERTVEQQKTIREIDDFVLRFSDNTQLYIYFQLKPYCLATIKQRKKEILKMLGNYSKKLDGMLPVTTALENALRDIEQNVCPLIEMINQFNAHGLLDAFEQYVTNNRSLFFANLNKFISTCQNKEELQAKLQGCETTDAILDKKSELFKDCMTYRREMKCQYDAFASYLATQCSMKINEIKSDELTINRNTTKSQTLKEQALLLTNKNEKTFTDLKTLKTYIDNHDKLITAKEVKAVDEVLDALNKAYTKYYKQNEAINKTDLFYITLTTLHDRLLQAKCALFFKHQEISQFKQAINDSFTNTFENHLFLEALSRKENNGLVQWIREYILRPLANFDWFGYKEIDKLKPVRGAGQLESTVADKCQFFKACHQQAGAVHPVVPVTRARA